MEKKFSFLDEEDNLGSLILNQSKLDMNLTI